jgi:hypothetical protein
MSLVKKFSVFALTIAVVFTMSAGTALNVKAAGSYGAGTLLAQEGVSGASVYIVGTDGDKYVFPDQFTYFTWYENWDGVVKVAVSELDMYANGGAVTYRPGTKLVTTMDTANVYGLEPGGAIRLLPDAATAEALYGADWATYMTDVAPGTFAQFYTAGDDLGSTLPTGTVVMEDGGDTYYYISDGVKRPFASMDAFEANNFNLDYVITADLDSYSDGDSITGEEDELSSFVPIDDDYEPTGDITVSIASDTPAAGIYPSTASGLEYTKFRIAGTGTVDGITLHRAGVGPTSDFINVYLYEGETRLTSGKTINSSTNNVEYNNLDLEVSGTTYLTVVADAAASKSGTHAFSVIEVELESGTANLGSVVGNPITLSPNNSGTVVITQGSNPSNGKVGETEAEFTSFTLTTATEDGLLERVSLYHAGAVSRSDLSNLKLYKQSKTDEHLIGEISGLDSNDLAVFELDTPVELDKGTGMKFYVYGDISGDAKSGSAETIKFYIDETTDVKVVGDTYGYPLGVDTYDRSWVSTAGSGTYNGSSTYFTTMYLEGSDVAVTTDGPSSQNVDSGGSSADDINFLNFAIDVTQEAEVKNIQIEFHAGTTDMDADDTTVTADWITDIKIVDVDTGSTVWGPVDLSGFADIGTSAGVSKNFTDNYTLSEGTHNFKVTADLKHASLGANSVLYVVLGDKVDGNTFTATSLKATGNNTYLTSIVPSSYTQGANMTLKGANLTITRATTPNSDDIVRGASTVTTANLIFSAADSGSDVKITSVQASGYVDGYSRSVALTKDETGSTLAITDLISVIRAYGEADDGSETLLGTKSFNTSGEATFGSLSWVIPAGETRNLRFEVDTNSGHTPTVGSTSLDAFGVDITDVTDDVAAETLSGTALTAAQLGTATYDLPNSATTAGSGPKFAMYTTGTITVQNGAAKPSVSLITTGSSDVYYHQLELYTAYESLEVSKMKFRASANAENFASVKLVGKNAAGDTVEYTEAVDANRYATFTGMNLFVDDDGENVDVYVTLNTVTNGASVGTAATWDLQTTGFEADGVGGSNSNVTSFTDSDSASNGLRVVKSKPVFANAGANGSLSDGVNTLYKFTVTPSGEDKISIKKLKFNVDATDASGTTLNLHSFRLYKGTSCTTGVDTAYFTDGVYGTATARSLLNGATAYFGDATASVKVYMFFEGASDSSYTDATDAEGELVVPVGGETYCLKATVAASATSDSITTSIAEEAQDTSGPDYGVLAWDLADFDSVFKVDATDNDIVWSDYSSSTSHEDNIKTGTSSDWFGGRYLPGVQTDATSLIKT